MESFKDDLISEIKRSKALMRIKDISFDKIYKSRSVVEREVAGYEVLGGLLDTFIHSYNEAYMEKSLQSTNQFLLFFQKELAKRFLMNFIFAC